MPKPGTLVMVQWKDAANQSSWGADAAVPTLAKCVSVGWLRKVARDRITMAASYGPDPDNATPWGQRSSIPRGSLVKVSKLRTGKKQ